MFPTLPALLSALCPLACRPAASGQPATGADTEQTGDSRADSRADSRDTAGDSGWPDLWSDDPCAGISTAGSGYGPVIARWQAEEALAPPVPGQIAVVGSSSIRRWGQAFRDLSPWGAVQRGFGGARMWEVAGWAQELAVASRPAAILLFAGTNDVADGAPAEAVVTAFRCFADRAWAGLGPVPIYYIGITPTPARWAQWATAAEVNRQIGALAAQHPGIAFIDVPAAFLATAPDAASPPDASLYVEDGLHLSDAGYALWSSVLLPALADLPARTLPANPLHPASGARLRVDLGPSNAEDGAPTGTDASGLSWNSWHAVDGDAQILPGEWLDLHTTGGAGPEHASGIRLVVTGGFLCNGFANGGLLDPDPALMQTMAVPSATGDFFYIDGPDNPGGLALTGLDPARRYTLRLFASRDWGDEYRRTRYTVYGDAGDAGAASGVLTTSGPGVGADGGDANDHEFAVFTGLQPDAWGQLHLDVEIAEGAYAYLSLLELEVE